MIKPDDCSLPPQTLIDIRQQADLLLKKAGAYGKFPTPISDIVAAANLTVAQEASLDSGFLSHLYKSLRIPSKTIKRALDKVLGLLDGRDRTIYLDHSVHQSKKPFLTLHEVGHHFLPWQRDTFAILEDSANTLDPDVREQFEREANVFTTEVLFQLDSFQQEVADHPLNLKLPMKLAKRYGASVYSTITRYVSSHHRSCVVLVLDQPESYTETSFSVSLRRSIQSRLFTRQYGEISWPEIYFAGDSFTAFLPINRKITSPRELILTTGSGEQVPCIAEAFNNSYQMFVLIYPETELKIIV